MNDADEKWQWVDEDPIEKLFRPTAGPSHSLPSHFDLAISLQKTAQWSAAADSFRAALEGNPQHAEALSGLGACLLHLDEADEALGCFDRLLQLRGDSATARFGMAVALQHLARYEEAEKLYRQLIEADPDAAEPLANLIALSVARQDAAAVFRYSQRLLRAQPQAKPALQGMAMLAIRSGNQTAAVEYCTRLVEVDPDCFEGWFNLRFAQQRMRPADQSSRSIA